MAAATSNKPSTSKVLRQTKRLRKDQSFKTSRDNLPQEQIKSANQRIPDSSNRRLYKIFETMTARIQVLEDHDLAHANAEPQCHGSWRETRLTSEEDTIRLLYKKFEATLTRIAVLESRRDIYYRNAFKAGDREECMIRGCGITSSSHKNAIRHLKNTATPEYEVAAKLLQQTECLQCDQKWDRPSGLAHHEFTVHQEIYWSRVDSFKPFIE